MIEPLARDDGVLNQTNRFRASPNCSNMPDFKLDGPSNAPITILLAHGAGGALDSPSMNACTKALSEAGLRVARFEFAYMAARRSGHKRPPPRAESLKSEYLDAVQTLKSKQPLVIGGKSMGGRVASMVADELHASGKIAGLLCLGYPFHPVGKPEQLRTAHLAELRTPTLIVQGTRDLLGTKDEVATYHLSSAIKVVWLEDGDHDLKPRKSISGFTADQHLKTMAETVASWSQGLGASHIRSRKKAELRASHSVYLSLDDGVMAAR